MCDINVGSEKNDWAKSTEVATHYKEKLTNLIKGLLCAEIIQISNPPSVNLIYIIVKKYGVGTGLCIAYGLVNDLT